MSGDSPISLGKYEVVDYRPDGAISWGDALQLIGSLGFVGIVLGIVAFYISQFLWMILIFPVIVGFAVGFSGSFFVKRMKIRNPGICGMAGFLAGCLAMLTTHYMEYRELRHQIDPLLGENADAVRHLANHLEEYSRPDADLPEDVKEVVKNLKAEPEFVKLLKIDSVWKMIDHKAHEGVQLKRARGGGGGSNLGYVGSYIYWIFEALIVAGVGYALMSSAAAEPFCPHCHVWKQKTILGPFSGAKETAAAIQEGMLLHFPPAMQDSPSMAKISIYACPECGTENSIDIEVNQHSVNAKGEAQSKRLVFKTYPGEALNVLQTACTLPEPSPVEETPPEESPSSEA